MFSVVNSSDDALFCCLLDEVDQEYWFLSALINFLYSCATFNEERNCSWLWLVLVQYEIRDVWHFYKSGLRIRPKTLLGNSKKLVTCLPWVWGLQSIDRYSMLKVEDSVTWFLLNLKSNSCSLFSSTGGYEFIANRFLAALIPILTKLVARLIKLYNCSHNKIHDQQPWLSLIQDL